MLPTKESPGPVKLAWAVFSVLLLVALAVIIWAVVEVVSYLT